MVTKRGEKGVGFVWFLVFVILTSPTNFFVLSAAEAPRHQHQELPQNAESRDLGKEHEHNHEVHCSRERSRVAWEIIEKYLMPFVERERYEISRSCRLHPDNDLFRDQEQHKIKADVNEWQCGYCKKSFLSEEFLDRHLDGRHYNLLNVIYVVHCIVIMYQVQNLLKLSAIRQRLQGIATCVRV